VAGKANTSHTHEIADVNGLQTALNGKFSAAGGTLGGPLTVTGAIVATGDITAFSDIRLKENFDRIDNALDKVEQLTGYTYDRLDLKIRQVGLIAQDVQKVLPEAVSENDLGLSVAYGQLAALFVEAIKEMHAEIRQLRKAA
jgi:hypothetical protein